MSCFAFGEAYCVETGMSCMHSEKLICRDWHDLSAFQELAGRDLFSMLCAGMTGYITGATLSSSMGRAVPVTLPSLQQAVVAARRA